MTSSWLLSSFLTLCLCVIHISADAESDQLCEDVQILTCDACIKAHPNCAWCLKSRKENANIKRCKSKEKFDKDGSCAEGQMEFPNSTVTFPLDKDLSEVGTDQNNIVQLKPQKIMLDLRKGEVKKFNVTYRKVSDYPVDLYYVMDLSNSMKDDLETLQKLGERLAEDIKNSVTQNIQLGFGTFVDKVMMPFASTVPAQLQNPCFKNSDGGVCAPPFSFKHQQPISDDLVAFKDAVTQTQISGNIDSPEGGFDALMQIAVCTDQIGWRNESTHLVVFTTDASFHMALDGKLAAILEMNDLGCHMQRGANKYLPNDVVYSKSKEQDYPSIGQLRHVFGKYKIQPIFAVTKEVKPLYDDLRLLLPNSYVDELAADSSNIINIIKDAYNDLKGKLEMIWTDKPKEIDMKYRVLCPGEDWKDQSLKCDNITINSEVVFEFEMTATGCPEKDEIPPMIFTSSSLQESVEIAFAFKCQCDCADTSEPESDECNGNGTLVCGVCQCDDQHEGQKCQCVRESKNVALVENCKQKTNGEICEGNGECECGVCNCNDGFSEKFCQCSDKGCPKDENQEICGGPSKGDCKNCNNNQTCVCRNGYTLDPNLKTCTCHEKECINPESNDTEVCSGHGKCQCNRCECDDEGKFWSEKYCQTCIHPQCKTGPQECTSTEFTKCALCVNQAQSQSKNVAEECLEDCEGIEKSIVREIPKCKTCSDEACTRICNRIDSSLSPPDECSAPIVNTQCDIFFQVVWFKDNKDFGIIVKEYNKDTDCREPINPIIIVLPIVAGIVLIGLLLLAAWKIYQTMRDKKEWENFEKEMKNSRWTKGQNPIFEKPMSKFQNPTYQGH